MSKEIARRDFFVGSTVRAAQAEGRTVDVETVGQEVARDLNKLDRARSLGDIKVESRNKDAPKPKRDDHVNHAASFASRMGSTTWERPVGLEREKPGPKLYGTDALRTAAMAVRVEFLLRPVPGYRLKFKRDPKTGEVTDCEPLGNGCQYPEFANLLLNERWCFSKPDGSYIGLPYKDRWRKYIRAIEDICDRSDAAVGVNWWCK